MSGNGSVGLTALALLATSAAIAVGDELPSEIGVEGTVVLQVHAVGAQIYECEPSAAGALQWHLREPIASLFEGRKTIGRHYRGPTWEVESSGIVGKITAHVPGTTAKDLPWLKLDVSNWLGDADGRLSDVTTIQQVNTKSGNLEGSCEKAGDLQAEPYSADYIFLEKSP